MKAKVFTMWLRNTTAVLRKSGFIAAILTAILGFATPTLLYASSEDAFNSGNQAFHDGDYESAIDFYDLAIANGYRVSSLMFNKGVAHYKLGQLDDAEAAFLQAAKNDRLAPISWYNLGLVYRKRGNDGQATYYFTRAQITTNDDRLKELAAKALESVSPTRHVVERRPTEDANAPVRKRKTGLDLAAGIRFGYDDNVFRSPSGSYVDLARSGMPVINPDPQSSFYIPVVVDSAYRLPMSQNTSFVGSYDLYATRYVDSDVDNADETSHRLAIGGEHAIGGRYSRSNRFDMELVYRKHEETNFDRDDGLFRQEDGQSIADRYDYKSLGFESKLRHGYQKLKYGLDLRYEQRDYEDTVVVSEYDHDYLRFGARAEYPLSDRSRIRFRYKFYNRDYDERRARDAMGDSNISNPTLEYDYHVYELSLRHDFSSRFYAMLSYARTEREDKFVRYNDYDEDEFELYARYRFNGRLRSTFRAVYSDQDYPNAFAFDNPVASDKEYQDLEVYATSEYRLTSSLSLWMEARWEDVDSSDPRGEYERLRAVLGITWSYD